MGENGAVDPDFIYTGGADVYAIQPLPGGDYLLGTAAGVARVNATGALVAPFPASGTGANGGVYVILELPDGRLLLGGAFTNYAGVVANRIIAIQADGMIAQGFAFGTGFNSQVTSVNRGTSGRIWAVGAFSSFRDTSADAYTVFYSESIFPPAPAPFAFEQFLAVANVPANQRGPADDPDADGVSNLLEFALGLNALIPDSAGLPVVAVIGGDLTLTYIRAQASAITYEVQSTTDLTTNSWSAAGVTQGTPAGDGLTTATIPYAAGPRYLRLSVTLNP